MHTHKHPAELRRRANSPVGQDRVLWYSSTFGDWDVSKGREPDEMEVLMYGGEMEHVSAPVFVTNWCVCGACVRARVCDQLVRVCAPMCV